MFLKFRIVHIILYLIDIDVYVLYREMPKTGLDEINYCLFQWLSVKVENHTNLNF